MINTHKKTIQLKSLTLLGFSLPETLIAASTGVLLIGASSLALRSTGSLISKMEQKAALQQNTISGKKLMRAEIERGLYIVIQTEQAPPEKLAHTNIQHANYSSTLKQCKALAEETKQVFQPIFGVKMAELNQPIFYGLSTSNSSHNFSLLRCGASMNLDGRYGPNKNLVISMVIDNIGRIRCNSDQPECRINKERRGSTAREIAEKTKFIFSNDKTPERIEHEPAIRIMTDENRKLIRFIDPTNEMDNIETSFLKIESMNKEITTQPFYFVAYARTNKQSQSNKEEKEVLDGLFFRNVNSKRLRFLIDGSGSMSACILWGSGFGQERIYWGGRSYFMTRRSCALTRMESLQHELNSLLTDLSGDTAISIRAFSSSGYQNHRVWSDSTKGLVNLEVKGARESAIAFVNTLDDGDPREWGGTQPWSGLDEAFADDETDTLYFLSDGEPNNNRKGGRWTISDQSKAPNYYSNLNNKRSTILKINTIALGLQASWMEELSNKTTGDYLFIDKKHVTSAK